MRYYATAAALAAVLYIAPAAAQQASQWVPLPGLRPTESGKAIIYDPQFVAKAEDDQRRGCLPGLQCRVQLLGAIEHNGAVELRATAFSW